MISAQRLWQLKQLIAQGNEERFYWWPEWDEIRAQVLLLDHSECQKCRRNGKHRRAVVVHHVKHLRDRPDLALSIFDPEDNSRQLVALCRQCHELEHPERLKHPIKAKKKKYLTEEKW